MLGSTRISAILGAVPPSDSLTPAAVKSFAKTATQNGLALLVLAPMSKTPVDLRSAVTKRKMDAEAQDAARAAGRLDWAKVRSLAGAHLATTDPTIINRYVTAWFKTYGEDQPINFAIEVGRSRLVVVDCDTAEQMQAFLDDSGIDFPLEPTVRTPGQKDSEGNWAHSDGGHFYFDVPDDVVLPTETGTWTAPGGYAVLWRDRYVLVPPSIRAEGPYRLTGREYPLPEWLYEKMNEHAARRVRKDPGERSAEDEDFGSAIDEWAESVSWSDILAPAGWTLTARPDRCGCDVWTAPGTHASPKSATTHDSGCQLGRYTEVNAPMHIWTDNPGEQFEAWIAARGGGKTLSKLQAVAVTGYGGDVGTAVAEMGVLPGKDLALETEMGVSAGNITDDLTLDTEPDDEQDTAVPEPECPHMSISPIGRCYSCGKPVGEPAQDTPQLDLFGLPEEGTEADTDPDTAEDETFPDEAPAAETPADDNLLNSDSNGVPRIAPFDYWRELPKPEYAIDGLIEHGALSCLIGRPGIGKSTVAIDMACHLVTGMRWQGRKVIRQKVLYLPGEGLAGAADRVRAWETEHGANVGQDLYVGNQIIQLAARQEDWAEVATYILKHRIGLVIFDTFARMSLGLEENSATEVGKAVLRFDQIRKLTGAGVLVVHHTGKTGNSGRGSSALNGALDSELLITEARWDTSDVVGEAIELTTSKQKNAAQLKDPIPLVISPRAESAVITGPSGISGDPFDSTAVTPLHIPEALVETAIRLYHFAERFPEQGVTRGDLVLGVQMDEYTASRKNPDVTWKLRVHEAVDLALRFGLLETLTGRPTGSRYLPSLVGPEAARQKAVEEAMTDGGPTDGTD